jgi:hypothetical protein
MRNARQPARFKHSGAGDHLDEATVGIGDAHKAATASPLGPEAARQQNDGDHRQKEPL